jgi:hypothetical protein
MCEVWERVGEADSPTEENGAAPQAPAGPAPAAQVPRAPRRNLWQRILGFFRRA